MYRKLLLPIAICLFSVAFAHEGMWIPSLLKINEGHMQSEGLRLSAEDIYSINQSSLKDAIVLFGGGCTAEIISDQGLLLTNHHCGFGNIRNHSTVENDYLKHGFWAANHSEELKNEGLSVTFVDRIEDVTQRVLEGTANLSPEEYSALLAEKIATIEAEIGEDNGLSGSVKPFFYGNEYYLIVSKTFRDIRLVGAPPSSIGKYGADEDNWMWPRHSADFSLFRIYADAENGPADPSDENIPFKPATSLKVSMKGAQEGDFAMIYGFPARTSTYLPSFAVEHIVKKENPAKIDLRNRSLAVLAPAMNNDPAIKIQYASKQSGISNAWKKWIGQNEGLKQLKAIQKKQEFEAEFLKIMGTDEALNSKYGNVLSELEKEQAVFDELSFARGIFVEMLFYGPDVLRFSGRFAKLKDNYAALEEAGKLQEELDKLQKGADKFFADHTMAVEQKMFEALFPTYLNYAQGPYAPNVVALVADKYKNNPMAYVSELFENSLFTDQAQVNDLLDGFSKGNVKKIGKDPLFQLYDDLYSTYLNKVRPQYGQSQQAVDLQMRHFVKAKMELFPDEVYWSDANSTLRLSYGRVEGSSPRDGMSYAHFSTLDGVIAKYIPNDPDFDLPEKLLELYDEKQYGQYADKDGTMHVCFTSSLHTTGGNSGSPVLNANGELIGLNFDRSWESTMSDIMFDPNRCRNISVDIRYVLFIIDELAGAKHLIEELDLVFPQKKEPLLEVEETSNSN